MTMWKKPVWILRGETGTLTDDNTLPISTRINKSCTPLQETCNLMARNILQLINNFFCLGQYPQKKKKQKNFSATVLKEEEESSPSHFFFCTHFNSE